MANVAGYLVPGLTSATGGLRPSWMSAPVTYNESEGWLGSYFRLGFGAEFQPVSELPSIRNGFGAFDAGYGALWYNRIHINPAEIDVGNLITDKQNVVRLWNSFFVTKNVQSLTAVDADGIDVNNPMPIPGTLGALAELTYLFTVTTAGPPVIDASYVWTIDGIQYPLPFSGVRVIVFPFTSNWESPPVESLSWLTSVERAYSGDEQRTRWRDAARKEMEFDVTLMNYREAQRLENLMFGWQSRGWAVPIITDRTVLTAPASAGQLSLQANTTNLGFYGGMPAILLLDSETYEAVDIVSVTSTSLTLARALTNSWPAGTPLFPAGFAQMSASQPLTRHSDQYLSGRFAWRFKVGDGVANTPTGTASLVYKSKEVFLTKPNWVETPTFTYQDAYDTFGDNSSGLLDFDPTSDWPTILRRARYDFTTKADILAFRAFLARRAGRWSPCWIPSWNDDFRLLISANVGASGLTVTNTSYQDFVDGHPARRNLAIFFNNRTEPMLLQISTATLNEEDGTVALALETPLAETIVLKDVKRVCHMNLFRLASDQVTFTWETPKVASVILNWQMVKE